jgi:hypothetical protein
MLEAAELHGIGDGATWIEHGLDWVAGVGVAGQRLQRRQGMIEHGLMVRASWALQWWKTQWRLE